MLDFESTKPSTGQDYKITNLQGKANRSKRLIQGAKQNTLKGSNDSKQRNAMLQPLPYRTTYTNRTNYGLERMHHRIGFVIVAKLRVFYSPKHQR